MTQPQTDAARLREIAGRFLHGLRWSSDVEFLTAIADRLERRPEGVESGEEGWAVFAGGVRLRFDKSGQAQVFGGKSDAMRAAEETCAVVPVRIVKVPLDQAERAGTMSESELRQFLKENAPTGPFKPYFHFSEGSLTIYKSIPEAIAKARGSTEPPKERVAFAEPELPEPLTMEEAEAALEAIGPIPADGQEVERLVQYATAGWTQTVTVESDGSRTIRLPPEDEPVEFYIQAGNHEVYTMQQGVFQRPDDQAYEFWNGKNSYDPYEGVTRWRPIPVAAPAPEPELPEFVRRELMDWTRQRILTGADAGRFIDRLAKLFSFPPDPKPGDQRLTVERFGEVGRAELLRLLEEFGCHKTGCGRGVVNGLCTCGLDKARAAIATTENRENSR